MAGNLQPLDQKFAVVDNQGRPTEYFTRWAQQKQIDIGDSITLVDLQDYLTAHALVAGVGIQFAPDGDINNSPTIHADVQAILDEVTATRGAVLYRGLLGWAALLPGTPGNFLQTAGAGADPLWAAAGGGGGGSTPTIRSVTALQSSSWATFNVPLPAGTVAGDVVIVFMENGFASGAVPAGWVAMAVMNNGFTNGYTLGKVVTAADVTAGSVTVTATGAFNGVTCAVCLTGTTVQSLGLTALFGSTSSTSFASAPINGLAGASATDLVIGMVATRGTMNVTLSAGLTSLSTVNGTNASAQLFKVNAAAIGKLGISETATFPVGNNGYVFSMFSFKGP